MSRASDILRANEGRVYKPLPGHPYHNKSDDQLRYIIKDAGEAADAMQGHNPQAEGKYRDQVNDAATILHYRSRFIMGSPGYRPPKGSSGRYPGPRGNRP